MSSISEIDDDSWNSYLIKQFADAPVLPASLDQESSYLSFLQEKVNAARDLFTWNCFSLASFLTDPICNAHALMRKIQVLDDLEKDSSYLYRSIQKIFYVVGIFFFASLGAVTSPFAIGLRVIGSFSQRESFYYLKGEGKEELAKNKFTLLSWNICCVGAGYPISDGGVVPFRERIDRMIEKIKHENGDVACLYETFDFASTKALIEGLKKDYAHFYFNMGPRAIGVNSGIFVASKFPIEEAEFLPFPKEDLVDRAQNSSKGVFSFTVKGEDQSLARIYATHLQHSEEPEFPDEKEKGARENEMNMILSEIKEHSTEYPDIPHILTGDLNLDDEELQKSFWKSNFVEESKSRNLDEKTWGGDAYCANLVGNKRISGALNLDHTLIYKNQASDIQLETTLVATGYDPKKYQKEALSDHEGLFSIITLRGKNGN